MKSPAHDTIEKPRASYTVTFGSRPGTYVPVAVIPDIPDWAFYTPSTYHGEGYLLEGNDQNGRFVIMVNETFGRSGLIPPGDWLIYYRYDHEQGCSDVILCVAARISQD